MLHLDQRKMNNLCYLLPNVIILLRKNHKIPLTGGVRVYLMTNFEVSLNVLYWCEKFSHSNNFDLKITMFYLFFSIYKKNLYLLERGTI